MSRLTAAQLDRACGVFLGAAAGDALGAGYEFGAAVLGSERPRMIGGGLGGFAPGEWTDDTSMTWAIADIAATGADLRSDTALDGIATRFRNWYDSNPADIGINTRAVISAAGPAPTGVAMTNAARERQESIGRTGSNGSLMRTAPVALAHLDDPEALVTAAMNVSALTHYDQDALEACVLWCLGLRHAVLTGTFDLRGGIEFLPESSHAPWQMRLDEAEHLDPNSFNPNGWVVTALQAAWAAISQTQVPTDVECDHLVAALEAAIGIGHDTDTVASIAGAMLGARWGMSAIPAEWRRKLHGYPGLTGLDLERLAFLAATGGVAGKYGWPLVDHIDYAQFQFGEPALSRHPHDEGVWLGSATALDDLPDGVNAVVSLCLTGRCQVPDHVEHINFRLMDEPNPSENPNLEYVLVDAARTVAALRDEGKTVLVHCVASHSRTPTVGIAYAMLRGVPADEAMSAVCGSLPAARPNSGFRKALNRLNFGVVNG